MRPRSLRDLAHRDGVETEVEGVIAHDIELDDVILARNISEVLHKHYPNHLWATWVASDQGVAVIKNLRVSETHGYLLKLKDLTPFDSGVVKIVMRAGGEILERAALLRGKSDGQFAEKVDGTGDKGRKIIV